MSNKTMVYLRFADGATEAGDLEQEIAQVLHEFADPASEASRSAAVAGLEPSDMADAQAAVTADAKGFGPVVIVVAISVPVASHVVNKFWDDVIWPRIKSKLGADALGEREE